MSALGKEPTAEGLISIFGVAHSIFGQEHVDKDKKWSFILRNA